MHDRALSGLGRGTSITSVSVNLVLWAPIGGLNSDGQQFYQYQHDLMWEVHIKSWNIKKTHETWRWKSMSIPGTCTKIVILEVLKLVNTNWQCMATV